MKRKRSENITKRDEPMLYRIEQIKSEHPLWGYRRIWSYMRFRDKIIIGKNRVYRIMKEHNLLVTKNYRLKAKRKSNRSKPRATRPNQYWGIDMTKIMIENYGWLYLHVVLDWYTKEIVGFRVSDRSKTDDWLVALNLAVIKRFPNGILANNFSGVCLISDNGSQPTSRRFMEECSILGIKQIFTTWSNPKGNSDTERVMRTIKEDLVWPREWNSPLKFKDALDKWTRDYNEDFPHQTLKNRTPRQFYKQFMEANTYLKSA